MFKKKFSTALYAFFLVTGLAACGGDPGATTQGTENLATLTNGTANADNPLVSISIVPSDPQIAQNTQLTFRAFGTYTDGTTQDITASVTWISSDPSIAEIDDSGTSSPDAAQGIKSSSSQPSPKFAQGKALGKTKIQADSGGVTGSTTLTVTSATLVAITVTPENASIEEGTSQQFVAVGTFSDSTSQDITTSVTWNSSDPGTAEISAGGVATAIAAGTAGISAISSDGLSGNATLTVTKVVASSPPSTETSPGTLSWNPPTTYSDGSPITEGDIQGYKVYYSASAGSYSANDYFFIPSPVTNVLLADLNLTPGTYYFVVTTLDVSDVESDFSNEVTKDVL